MNHADALMAATEKALDAPPAAKVVPEVGIHYGVPFAEYIAWDAVNNSVLKELPKTTPKHARHYQVYGKETPYLAFGRLYHVLLLDPDSFDDCYVIGPEVHRNTNEWKDFAKKTTKAGKEPIKPSEHDMAVAFRDAVKKQDVYRFINKGKSEVSLVWKDDEPADVTIDIGILGEQTFHFEPTNCLCKARMDYEHRAHQLLVDLKGVQSANPAWFPKTFFDFGYYQQAGMTSDGWEKLTGLTPAFNFVCVEKCPGAYDPKTWHFETVAYEVQPKTMAYAQLAWRMALKRYAECLAEGKWPGYSDGEVVPLELDDWMLSKIAGAQYV